MRYLEQETQRVHLYSIGKSIYGRELNVVAISYDRPSEIVPTRVEVQYVGQLRGNEVGYQ